MITGAFVRIKRGDKWQSVDIGDLTPKEIESFCAEKTAPELCAWVSFLVGFIRGTFARIEGIPDDRA